MTEREIYMNLFNVSINTYYNWKKEDRPIINLLDKYFSKEDLEEFLKTGEITKLEKVKTTSNQFDYINDLLIDNAKYTLREKLNKVFESSMLEMIYTYLSKKILIRVLDKLSIIGNEYPINLSKKYLLAEIKSSDIKLFEKYKLNVLIKLIEDNFSNLECYALIKYYKELFGK